LFQRAVEADPSHAPSWQAYALFEKEQRQYDEARRLLEEGLRHVRDGRGKGLLHSTLGGLLAGGGDLAAAESHFRKALQHDDENAMTHYYFAINVLLRTARREEACRHLCRAKALRIKKPHERAMIEKALERNGCQCNGSR
jgi:tetratricopeptide (TPR) repeat protein